MSQKGLDLLQWSRNFRAAERAGAGGFSAYGDGFNGAATLGLRKELKVPIPVPTVPASMEPQL